MKSASIFYGPERRDVWTIEVNPVDGGPPAILGRIIIFFRDWAEPELVRYAEPCEYKRQQLRRIDIHLRWRPGYDSDEKGYFKVLQINHLVVCFNCPALLFTWIAKEPLGSTIASADCLRSKIVQKKSEPKSSATVAGWSHKGKP